MYKKQIVMGLHIVLFFILAACSPYLCCMDIGCDVVLKQLIVGFVDNSHNMLCCLKVVDKIFHKIIKNSAQSKKNHLQEILKKDPSVKYDEFRHSPIWHANGKMCAFVEKKDAIMDLVLAFLTPLGQADIRRSVCNCRKPLLEKSSLFFDYEDRICFYSSGCISIDGYIYGAVIEYTINVAGLLQARECFIDLKYGNDPLQSLVRFKPYPRLLQSFLRSTVVREDDEIKVFDIRGIIVSDECIKECIGSKELLIKNLPKKIKKPIMKQYNVTRKSEQKKVINL